VDAEWITSPTGQLVLAHWADSRPAWLWSQDGETLLWRNGAARCFRARTKKHGLKLAPDVTPIKGQVARLIRLGSMNRPSLSRIQFLAGEKPISTTCICTPLRLDDGSLALLIVGVDAVDGELLEAGESLVADSLTRSLLPDGASYALLAEGAVLLDGVPDLAGQSLKAGPDGQQLVLGLAATAEPESTIARVRADDGEADEEWHEPAPQPSAEVEPLLPMGLPDLDPVADEPASYEDQWVEPPPPPSTTESLASLFDRLADEPNLYAPLTEADETFAGPLPLAPVFTLDVPNEAAEFAAALADDDEEPAVAVAEAATANTPPASSPDLHAPEMGAAGDDAPLATTEPSEPERPAPGDPVDEEAVDEPVQPEDLEDGIVHEPVTVWRIVGRGFTPIAATPAATLATDDVVAAVEPRPVDEAAEPPHVPDTGIPDAETVERVSRYNFDELSRILTDRVSGPQTPASTAPPAAATPAEPTRNGDGALISLSGETFILNRLPLGILVFRDQQVLFANRALTDLIGYENIEAVRAAGLASIFPSDGLPSGPVTQLVRRDGAMALVSARLQSISWHGKPSLMLSASPAENQVGHEGAVRVFAQLAADTNDDGFIAADPSGSITSVSLHARILLGATEDEIIGRPLAAFVDPVQIGELRQFMALPARFAETVRPAITLRGLAPGLRLALFAQGQAGIVAGYFGYLRRMQSAPVASEPSPVADDVEPSMLTRITRSVRRPLNTVIGFADLIHTAEPGAMEAQRTQEYVQDIRTAGIEIATLVEELDDYARLREGRYPASPDDIDLVDLLEASVARIRQQASNARVLLRSAISENLPRITADRASLTQAVLNLLASAIDQTPAGSTVILSANRGDDGGLVVNIRDSGETRTDLGERFVVFRDGVGKDGERLQPVRSSVGLALTRSLLAVNALSLSVDPAVGSGNLFSLVVPPDLVRS